MNNMKKLMENWRRAINEDIGSPKEVKAGSKEAETLHSLVKMHYPEFVNGLSNLIKDPNFLNFLKQEDPDNPNNHLNVEWADYSCLELKPMQNIIGLDDSLAYELKDPAKTNAKASGTIIGPDGYDYMSRPIITCGNYIVDGHHRWSTVYMLNPKTSLRVRNITNFKDGTSGLKASQLIIAAIKGKIPISDPKGINVYTEGLDKITQWISANMSPAFVDQYYPAITKNRVQEVRYRLFENAIDSQEKNMCVQQLIKNIELLRTNNKPEGAAAGNPRTIMPQYSDAKDNELVSAINGKLNLKAIKGALGAVNEKKKVCK